MIKHFKIGNAGNALLLILIATALFAALSYTVFLSGKNARTLSDEELALGVAQMLDYASKVDQAVRHVMLENGCTETQVSFLWDSDGDGSSETNGDDWNYNPLSPPDNSCHIFEPEGGGLVYQDIPQAIAADPIDYVDVDTDSFYWFTSQNELQGIGESYASGSDNGTDIVMFGLNITEDACKYINRRLNIGSDITQTNVMMTPNHNGEFPEAHNDIFNTAGSADLAGKMQGCVLENNISSYHYFHVLIVR